MHRIAGKEYKYVPMHNQLEQISRLMISFEIEKKPSIKIYIKNNFIIKMKLF